MMTVGEHGSKESLNKVAACLSASVSALQLVQLVSCGRTGSLCCTTGILDDDTSAIVCSCLGC